MSLIIEHTIITLLAAAAIYGILRYLTYPFFFILYCIFGSGNINDKEAKDKPSEHKPNLMDRIYFLVCSIYQKLFLLRCAIFKPKPVHIKTLNLSELDQFVERSDNLTQPMIIRGGAKDTEAVKKWSFDHFVERYGDEKVICLDDSSLETRNAFVKERTLVNARKRKLKDIFAGLKEGKHLYINAINEILKKNPELLEELESRQIADKIRDLNGVKFKYKFSQIFIGRKDSVTPLHRAMGLNIFANVVGSKTWFLMHPKYKNLLRETPSGSLHFGFSQQDIFDKNDLCQKIPHIEIKLEPGDLLIVPNCWWHAVRNETEFCIGVASRISINVSSVLRETPMYVLLFVWQELATMLAERRKARKEKRTEKVKTHRLNDKVILDGYLHLNDDEQTKPDTEAQ